MARFYPRFSMLLSQLNLNTKESPRGANFYLQVLVEKLEASYRYANAHEVNFKDFTENDFRNLEKLIKDRLNEDGVLTKQQRLDLGTTVAVSTLKRIFKYGYDVEDSIEARQRKNLDKLCIYLGYKDWLQFIGFNSENYRAGETYNAHLPTEMEIIFIMKLLNAAKRAEFQAYKSKLNRDIRELEEFYVNGDKEVMEIRELIQQKRKSNQSIDTLNNPSGFEVDCLEILMLSKSMALAAYSVAWNLWWCDVVTLQYLPQFGNATRHYLVFRIEDRWYLDSNPFRTIPHLKELIAQSQI
jgi:hypothetical protein